MIALGPILDDPVEFIICWTPGGKVTGGTGQAIRIAKDLDIRVFNLALRSDTEAIKSMLNL